MKTTNFILCTIGAALLMSSCNSSQQKNENDSSVADQTLNNRPFINDPNTETFRFFLNIMSEEATDTSVIYTARSLYESDTVGLNIEVLKNIPAGVTAEGQPDEDNGFIEGAITFSSIGAESDNFVKALQEVYGIDANGTMTGETIRPLVFSSNNEAVDLNKKTAYSFKLFIGNPVGAEAEVFVVLDTYRKSFEITEKDDTYRAQLISAFTGEQ